jgi:hypothetical protein
MSSCIGFYHFALLGIKHENSYHNVCPFTTEDTEFTEKRLEKQRIFLCEFSSVRSVSSVVKMLFFVFSIFVLS